MWLFLFPEIQKLGSFGKTETGLFRGRLGGALASFVHQSPVAGLVAAPGAAIARLALFCRRF